MPFISYARNSEDVLLWRAFNGVGAGFYVDVGAAHPDEGSATRAFYDRGWHGINMAAPSLVRRIAAARPRDVTMALEAPQRLASALDRHAPEDVHFLKIGAETAGNAVLEGFDFRAHRPRVVLVEASHETHEDVLAGAGYRFVFFDGLNRFHVADEWMAALAPHFSVPANVGDDYVRVADAAWVREAALREAASARASVAEASARDAYARAFEHARDLGLARLAADRAREEADALRRTADAQRARLDAVERELDASVRLLDAMHRSTSWRVTKPVRALSALVRPPHPSVPPSTGAPEQPPLPVPEPVAGVEGPAAPFAPPELIRTVHQFHSGSALGDAVTNSLLLIRGRLRALGYRSDIFVQHRGAGLESDLHLVEDLPRHPGYILIIHHSMGHGVLGEVLALPAPKVLYYHNVTPPEFLPQVPFLRRQAAAGREQLGQLRPAVAAALAASEYNASELRRAGFAPVQACTLLFDLDAMHAAGAAEPAPERPGFTVLFVGRLIESKGQADLVDAFACFRDQFGPGARLVLVGRTDSPGGYLAAIDARIRAHGLQEAVVVTGPISDAALRAQYAVADLYVSLSHHEGFGVPLAEAAMHGIPVLAWPCGAVPYTLAVPDGLLATRDPDGVAARMLALARDPAQRAALVRAQQGALEQFALHRQWPAMQDALARAGAAPPPSPAAAKALAANLHFAVTGHAAGTYSLAAVNRGLAGAIEAELPGLVRLVPYENGPVADLSALPPAARALAERPPAPTGPVAAISNHYPIHVPDMPCDLKLAMVFWEESVLPPHMVAALNEGFDGVLAPSRFVAKVLVDSGLSRPVRVVGQAPSLQAFEAVARSRGVAAPSEPFTFLHVSSCFPRKGADVLLAAYARAFRRSDPVRLVVKGFPNPHNDVPEQVAALQARDPDAPDIAVINRDLDDAAVLDLFRQADAMVLPTRGEGLNLPAAEAMAAGLPLIVTGFGGHLDFCDSASARLLRYRMAPSGSHLASPFSLWAEPDEDDLVAALREAAAARRDPNAAAALAQRAAQARVVVAQRLRRRTMVRRIREAAVELLLAPAPEPLRVGWVTSWATRCGVAEYSRHLLDALPEDPALSHVVLSDDRSAPAGRAQPRSVPAWTLGGTVDTTLLERAVTSEDPGIVVVQHQPGLLPWAALASLLRSPAMAGRIAVVTLHATRDLLSLSSEAREAACAALRGAARVLVHTLADLHRLQNLDVSENVTLMPHGVRDARPRRAVRDGGGAPLIGCYGFFLPDKGIGELIEAAALLRAKRPGTRLQLVNADYGAPISTNEIARCRALADALGLGGAIEWDTRFLPDDDSVSLLSQCDVIAVPTQQSNEASSATVRTALAAGPPVLTTPLPLFDDVGDAVVRSAGTSPADLAAALDSLLSSQDRQARAHAAAQDWLEAHAWPSIARRFQGMLRGLHASHEAADQPPWGDGVLRR